MPQPIIVDMEQLNLIQNQVHYLIQTGQYTLGGGGVILFLKIIMDFFRQYNKNGNGNYKTTIEISKLETSVTDIKTNIDMLTEKFDDTQKSIFGLSIENNELYSYVKRVREVENEIDKVRDVVSSHSADLQGIKERCTERFNLYRKEQ